MLLNYTKSFSKVYVIPVSKSRFHGLLVCLSKFIIPKDILILWGILSICDFYEKGHEYFCEISSLLLERFSYYQSRFIVDLEIGVDNITEHLRYSY